MSRGDHIKVKIINDKMVAHTTYHHDLKSAIKKASPGITYTYTNAYCQCL